MKVVSLNELKIGKIYSMMLSMDEDLTHLYQSGYLSISEELKAGVLKLVEADMTLFKSSVSELISCAVLMNAYKIDLQTVLHYFKFNRATEHLHSLWLKDTGGIKAVH